MEVPPLSSDESNLATRHEKGKGGGARARIYVLAEEEGEGVSSRRLYRAVEGSRFDQGLYCYN